ncbi:hypothetical protein LAZ67_21000359 [Cordylochernes scorpioides]|uniref:HTH psq-type domain-containing protein n=1 Tax=Cordylochernes scorpioides TaxID=51811 RepID=A0ABY6LLP6_9ARAC|nr:hypothetical protein LAZ67_21000359 [Cordylochernes scorpioides]
MVVVNHRSRPISKPGIAVGKFSNVHYVLEYHHALRPMKKRLIQTVEDGQLKDVAKQFGILPSTLSMILKNKVPIIWFHQCRGQNVPVGGFTLKEKTKSFAQSLGIKAASTYSTLTGIFFYKCLPDLTLTFKVLKCHGGKLNKDR